jgi:adenylate kinase
VTRFIFLGPPGAGKGTQAALLSESCDLPHISTGEILRSEVASQSLLGLKAKGYMDSGQLVPDELILDMVRNKLSSLSTDSGWILDGFPRNVSQAVFLEQFLEDISQTCDWVINIEVEDAVLIDRLLAANRNRQDDTEDVIRNRLKVYHSQTAPLIDFYRDRNLLMSINGHQAVESIFREIRSLVKE